MDARYTIVGAEVIVRQETNQQGEAAANKDTTDNAKRHSRWIGFVPAAQDTRMKGRMISRHGFHCSGEIMTGIILEI
jgi:hypothetical protein